MSDSPFFSIIIPTYGRPRRLAACLNALTHLTYPRNCFEVVVVDDGNPHPLDATVAPFRASLPITLIRQANAGPATARNTGAWQAQGQFLAFTDDDCSPAPDWLTCLAAQFAHTPENALGGHTINALPDNVYSATSQALIDYLYSYYNASPQKARFFASNNLAVPAERFRAMGGFDTTMPLAAGEDREFCDRWLHGGHQMSYVPQAIIYHSHCLSRAAFWRQHFNYGQGACQFHQIRSHRAHSPVKLEPLSFYINLLVHPMKQRGGRKYGRSLTMSFLLLLSQVANAAGFFWQKFHVA